MASRQRAAGRPTCPSHRRRRKEPRRTPRPLLNPPDTPESELKKRTLTNLYNARPQWLDDAHRTLDRAVFAAYGWPDDLTDQQILEKLLALNHERAAAQDLTPKPKPAKPRKLASTPNDTSAPPSRS